MQKNFAAREPINIVVCADGTGNTTIKGRGSNVFSLYESVEIDKPDESLGEVSQVALYDDGVGTAEFLPIRLWDGATGLGVFSKVERFSAELGRVFRPGDNLYLFGFSRGAYTARVLAGFIYTCGIPKVLKEKKDQTEDAEKDADERGNDALYRKRIKHVFTRYRDLLTLQDDKLRAAACRALQSDCEVDFYRHIPIHFVGLWDTVAAIGGPMGPLFNSTFDFGNYFPTPSIVHGRHALALDDSRRIFHPRLWDEHTPPARQPQPDEPIWPRTDIEQVWFAGAHSNVGGGYERQGLGMTALKWMMDEAAAVGLRFCPSDKEYVDNRADVHDRLYDSRAGSGMFYAYAPRDVEGYCRKNGARLRVHASAYNRARRATEGYAPLNLPAATTGPSTELPPAQMVDEVRSATTQALAEISGSLICRPEVQKAIVARQHAHWIRVGALVCAIFALLQLAAPAVLQGLENALGGLNAAALRLGLEPFSPSLVWQLPLLVTLLSVLGWIACGGMAGLGPSDGVMANFGFEPAAQRRMRAHTPQNPQRDWYRRLWRARATKRGFAALVWLMLLLMLVVGLGFAQKSFSSLHWLWVSLAALGMFGGYSLDSGALRELKDISSGIWLGRVVQAIKNLKQMHLAAQPTGPAPSQEG